MAVRLLPPTAHGVQGVIASTNTSRDVKCLTLLILALDGEPVELDLFFDAKTTTDDTLTAYCNAVNNVFARTCERTPGLLQRAATLAMEGT